MQTEINGFGLTGLANPLIMRLIIGDDGGSTKPATEF